MEDPVFQKHWLPWDILIWGQKSQKSVFSDRPFVFNQIYPHHWNLNEMYVHHSIIYLFLVLSSWVPPQ